MVFLFVSVRMNHVFIPYEIMKDMMKNGYKFYQNGKIYKPEKKQEK